MAQERCQGLDVTILLQDYRDLDSQFDRIVSVGMFEHVGPKNYATYFEVADRNLKPDGLFLLHTIGSRKTDNNVDPWIDKYIFPNGCLPSARQIAAASEPHFVMEDWHNFGADYDKTLMAWYARFLAAWPEIADNYSERFKTHVYLLSQRLCGCLPRAGHPAVAGGLQPRRGKRPARRPLSVHPGACRGLFATLSSSLCDISHAFATFPSIKVIPAAIR